MRRFSIGGQFPLTLFQLGPIRILTRSNPMVHSVSSVSSASQWEAQQSQHASHPAKTKKPEHQDTVELSEKAQAAARDQDHKPG